MGGSLRWAWAGVDRSLLRMRDVIPGKPGAVCGRLSLVAPTFLQALGSASRFHSSGVKARKVPAR
jgi:hypothetical protein